MLCKIWGFHGGAYEECRLLGYKRPVRTSQETHYLATTELSRLMLCKIWGFHGGDYEECRLLGYKHPVRTPQETHYVTTTESRLMLCKSWGFHGSDYEECRLLGRYAVWLLLRTDVSEELSASIIRVTRIGELGTMFIRSVRRLLVTANVPSSSILVALMEAPSSSETSGLTRVTWRNIPEDGILYLQLVLLLCVFKIND
jgi:hypothetical protein